jgi:PhnB protein
MASKLNPYLHFDGTARQAMEFYQSVFGGDLKINTFGELGVPDRTFADKVMHAQLTTENGYLLMASDAGPGMPVDTGSAITVSLSGDPGEGLEEVWEKLADGGTVTMPFEKQMWGDTYGQVTDKFGTPWMVDVLGSQG